MVLKPGGSVTYRLLFKPERVGFYVHTFTLQVVGWPTQYFLTCEGNCEIPKLNIVPEIIFPKVLKKRTKKALYHNCIYLSNDEVFDFGPILAQSVVDPIKLAVETEFNLTNISLITCEASCVIRSKPRSFVVDENALTILPGSTQVLDIKAIASAVTETNEDQLLISIKDNPEIFSINLRSESTPLSFAVSSKSVRFERVLVNDTEERTLDLQNQSFVPLAWQLVNLQSILKKFAISPLQGYIEPRTTQNVNIEFFSPVKLVVPDQMMKVEVYDKDYKSPIPLHLETVHVGAEAIQVSIDCPRTLNLYEVKGQKELIIPYTLISTGKYGVEFTFLPVSKQEDPNRNQRKTLRSSFTATPSSGILRTNTPFDIVIKFLGTKPIKVKDAPVYKVTFVDQVFKKFIDSFLLTATLKTEFSLFELFPPTELNFGYQLLGINATQTITVSNCGKFDFDYQVLSLKEILEARHKSTVSDKSVTKKGSSKPEKASKASKKGNADKSEKGDTKAKIITTLAVGEFTLTPSSGTVKAGTVATISVTARSNHLGTAQEVVVVKVSETEDADKEGRQITLSITAFLPTVNFSDYNAIFREQFVVESMTAFESSGSNNTKAVFIKNDKRLHFPNVPINTKAQARIRLENVSPVPADLQCVIRSREESSFIVAPARVNIEPYSTNYTTVTFQPSSIERMEGSLSIQYYGVDASYNANRFHITLSGEGVVPEVAITSPKYDSSIGCYVVNFSPTFIGDTATDSITIQNIGAIPCQVILEVSDDTMNVFSIAAHQHTKPKLKIQDYEGVSHTNLVHLNVEELGEFYLQFQPNFPASFSCVVKLHLINNPYETRMIAVTGLGYTDSVRLKDLGTCAIKKSSSSTSTLEEDIIAYTIEFGALAVNKPRRKCFKIVNASPTQTYKFEFVNWDKVSFVPSRGHLKPAACKDVIATFKSKEPCTVEKIPLLCTLCQIEYVDPQIELLSWDDRQTVVLWEDQKCLSSMSVLEHKAVSGSTMDVVHPNSTSTTKIVKDKDEPSTNIIPDTKKSISILISATCDHCSYNVSLDEIEFPDTFAFERKTATFEITNTSNVYLEVRWNITVEENLEMNSPVEDPSSNTFEVASKPRKTSRPTHLSGAEKFLYNDSLSGSSAKFSLFSEESNISWLDDGTPPFDLAPNPASVAPMESQKFVVTFSPKSIAEYLAHVTANISNLPPSSDQLDIKVKANSLLPAFYFNVEPSDYVVNRRKVSVTCGDLVNENTEVVEFEAVGLAVAVERSFYVVNPTEQTLLYNWTEAFPSTSEVSLFYCCKPQGLIEKRKKASMTFSFMPPSTGTFEAFYIFSVDKHKLTKTFLMVGHAREPVVFFANPYLQIRPSVIGVDIIDSTCIKNNEDFEIDFKFEKESIYGDAHQQKLTVVPLKGNIGPHEEKKISITFHPVKVGEVGFNLKCSISKMKNPLLLTVSATCYEIQSQVFYETGVGKKVFLHPSEPNMLELKSLAPLLTQDIIFTMTNIGEIGFYYAWILKEDLTTNKVDIIFEQGNGFVPVTSEKSTRMCVTPLTNVSIKNTIIKLQIRYGLTYTIYLSGATSLPFFNFSVNEYNFGICLVQKEMTDYYKTIVEFNNGDDAPITLECKQPEVDFLTVKFKSKQVQGRQTEPIEVHFHPFKVQTYTIYVTFYVNSRPHELCFRGEGVANSVLLANFSDKFLNFGEVAVGGSSKRAVSVLNNSDAYIDIIFDLPDCLPIFSRPRKRLEPQYEPGSISSSKSKQSPRLGKKDGQLVTIVPKKFTRVPPHQATQFISTYTPTERMKAFSGKIAYQVQDIVETLCTFKGSCVGPDYTLDKTIIPFGCVILGYSNKQKAMLNNVGDVGGAFKWTFEKYHPCFTITPEHGFVSPGTSAVFTVQFNPSTLGSVFEAKIKCIIGGYKKSLEMQLSGSCIGMPPAVERIEFECPVRSSTKRFINIENPSAQTWRVATTIEGQYFISKNVYVVKPKSVLPCEVSYSPLTMTGKKPHRATIFFAYPEGLGVLYELSGRTTPPLVVDRIQREITCKTLYKETLIVKNWQKRPQSFEVITENSSPSPILYKLEGNPSIEVLGQSERPYTWSIYVLKEGTLHLKVMFRNKETKEYLYYEVILKVLKSPPLDVITLNTCVRKSLTYSITLENPLSRPVTYTAKSTVPELSFVSPQTVPALSESKFVITFLPLTEGESEAHIDLISSDLGIYPYDFKLITRPPVPDQQLFFIARLGQTATQRASVTNTAKATTTLAAQFTEPTAFFIEGNITVSPHTTKEFLVRFEPYEIGTLKSVLTLHSPATGSYA
ncbi:hypothetical protein PPYR_09010 [Photinus pyralis]|nr:hypothetical protein PPYR_09010 [Photinus pyralis]